LHLFEKRDEMFKIAAEAIETPHDQHVESPPFGVGDDRVECGPAVLGAGDAVVDVLARRPSASRNVAVQFEELVVTRLI
jgi:hypothetical protein